MKIRTTIIALLCVLLLFGCAPSETARIDSENTTGSWTKDRLDERHIDRNIYHISGVVAHDVDSLTRQTRPASGSYAGYYGGGGYGYYSGAQFGGKGFIRLLVEETDAPVGQRGQIVILKVVDSKSVALLPGDRVKFKCRYQPEVVDAMYYNEEWTDDALIYELDYCRLDSPVIQVTEGR